MSLATPCKPVGESAIPQEIIEAYRQTDYRVDAETPFVLRIGSVSPGLQALHERYRVASSAFVTAWNPYSEVSGESQNIQRQEAMESELRSRGLAFLRGEGKHPDNGWPGEDSLLVLGLGLEAAKSLCNLYEQNGFVWSGADAVPTLCLLR